MSFAGDFKNQTAKLREAITANLPAIAEGMVITAKALAERRMKEQGFGVLYSSHQVPAWFFHGKELNARGTKFLEQRGVNPSSGKQGAAKKKRRKAGEKEDPGFHLTTTTWGEFRQAQGLQAAFVDLSYSNKMFSNMQPILTEWIDGKIVVTLGGTNRETQNKMNWNRDRYGDFLRKSLNEDDGRLLAEYVITEVDAVINQIKI